VRRRRLIAVREIAARRVGNLRPERMRPRLPDRTPPHVGHLEPVAASRQHVFITKAHDAALYTAQRGSGSFLAFVEQHLQPEADPEKGTTTYDFHPHLPQPL